MHRKLAFLVAIVTALFGYMAVAPTADAVSPHWVVSPYCSGVNQITGQPGYFQSLSCSGKAAGLGNGPIYVVVTADAGCTNQDGTHVIPGKSTTTSGPFFATNGNFTFGAEDNSGTNKVTATGPTSCNGASQTSFITTKNVYLSIYQCAEGDGGPTFNKKGQQTNPNCTLALGPTAATIV